MSADALAAKAVPPLTTEWQRARWSTRAQFAALGVVAGLWGAHIPSVKSVHALTEITLSMILLTAALGAISSLFFAGRLVAGLGARRTSVVAGWTMCAMFALFLVVPGFWLALPVAYVFGAGMSLFDVSINSEGSELESITGRPIMSNLHGMFSLGAMGGALLAVLVAQVATGLLSDDEIAFAGPLTRFVSNAVVGQATGYHKEIGQYLVLGLVGLHLIAIIFYVLVRRQRLVRPMLHGDKLLPAPATPSRDDLTSRAVALVVLALSAALAWWVSSLGAAAGF